VNDEAGEPMWDQPVWVEPPGGAVLVPVLPDGRVVLLRHYRPVAAPPGFLAADPTSALASAGAWSLEFPRGFAEPGETAEQAALREAEEETSLRATGCELLGYCNPNTSFQLHSVAVMQVELSEAPAERPADADAAQIGDRLRLSGAEVAAAVARGEVFCGFTLAALALWWGSRMGREAG